MNPDEQIEHYLASQPQPRRDDMRALHHRILGIAPDCRTWFLDGRDGDGKIVSNPNIGYGERTIHYANGRTREFYRIGLSANTTGISVYIMGFEDRKYLPGAFGKRIGKASVTGYCVKFRTLEDIDLGVLGEMIRLGFEA